MRNKARLALTAAIIAATLPGCASHNYTDAPPTLGVMYSKYVFLGYDGEQRPIEDVGIVTTDGFLLIQTVDGQSLHDFKVYKSNGLYSKGRFQLHLLPGEHTLTMAFRGKQIGNYVYSSKSNVTKTINIDKGQVIHLQVTQSGNKWGAFESDGSSALASITQDFKDLTKK